MITIVYIQFTIFLLILFKNFFYNFNFKNIKSFIISLEIDIIFYIYLNNIKIIIFSFFLSFFIIVILNLIQYEIILYSFFTDILYILNYIFFPNNAYCMNVEEHSDTTEFRYNDETEIEDIRKKILNIFEINPKPDLCFNNLSIIDLDYSINLEDIFDHSFLGLEISRIFPSLECFNMDSVVNFNFIDNDINLYILKLNLDYDNIIQSRLKFLKCLENFDTEELIINKKSYINKLSEMQYNNLTIIKQNFNVYSKIIENYVSFQKHYDSSLIFTLNNKNIESIEIKNMIKGYVFPNTSTNILNLNKNINSLNIFLLDYNNKLNFLENFLLDKKFIHLKTCYKNPEFTNQLVYELKEGVVLDINTEVETNYTLEKFSKIYNYHDKPAINRYLGIQTNRVFFAEISELFNDDSEIRNLENEVFSKIFSENKNFQNTFFKKGFILSTLEKEKNLLLTDNNDNNDNSHTSNANKKRRLN